MEKEEQRTQPYLCKENTEYQWSKNMNSPTPVVGEDNHSQQTGYKSA